MKPEEFKELAAGDPESIQSVVQGVSDFLYTPPGWIMREVAVGGGAVFSFRAAVVTNAPNAKKSMGILTAMTDLDDGRARSLRACAALAAAAKEEDPAKDEDPAELHKSDAAAASEMAATQGLPEPGAAGSEKPSEGN